MPVRRVLVPSFVVVAGRGWYRWTRLCEKLTEKLFWGVSPPYKICESPKKGRKSEFSRLGPNSFFSVIHCSKRPIAQMSQPIVRVTVPPTTFRPLQNGLFKELKWAGGRPRDGTKTHSIASGRPTVGFVGGPRAAKSQSVQFCVQQALT
jgi:hypothetical protein